MNKSDSQTFIQFIKFGVVGVSNTLITAIVIWVLLKQLYTSDYFANIIGYIAGLINSFFWNRKWTFASKSSLKAQIPKFILTFAVSYLFQLGNLYLLLNYTKIDPYICQLLSIVVYTVINFLMNKYFTFNENSHGKTS